MAITFTSDLLPYENLMRSGYVEGLTHNVNILNQGSNGTLRLESELTAGTLKKEAFWKDFLTFTRRDITVQTALTAEKIERNEHTAFKTFWRTDPVEWLMTSFKTSDNMSDDEVVYMIGKKVAEKKIAYTVKQAIACVAAAIGSQTSLVVNHEDKNYSLSSQIKATAAFGDQSYKLKALIMHSAPFFTLFKDQMLNSKFTLGEGLMMFGGTPATMGLPVIVTDNSELMYTSASDNQCYRTLLLTDSAVVLKDNGNTQFAKAQIVGYENLASMFQCEGDMWNYVKGYQLKSTAGTNPAYATLTSSSNWEMWVNDKSLTAGCLIKSQGDLDAVTQIMNVKVVS